MCYLFKLLVLTFFYNIYINQNKYFKKMNYFVFTINKVNKHQVSRKWFTKTDTKHLQSDALRTNTNTTRSMVH